MTPDVWRLLGPVAANFENDYKRKEKLYERNERLKIPNWREDDGHDAGDQGDLSRVVSVLAPTVQRIAGSAPPNLSGVSELGI